jgi:hypothetical protein
LEVLPIKETLDISPYHNGPAAQNRLLCPNKKHYLSLDLGPF